MKMYHPTTSREINVDSAQIPAMENAGYLREKPGEESPLSFGALATGQGQDAPSDPDIGQDNDPVLDQDGNPAPTSDEDASEKGEDLGIETGDG